MGAQEAIHKRNVNPKQEVFVGSLILATLSGRSLVLALDSGVQAIDAICFFLVRGDRAEGCDSEPTNGSGETTKRVIFISRVLANSGE